MSDAAEEVIWEGHPPWRAWPGELVLASVLCLVLVGFVYLAVLEVRRRSSRWKLTTKRIETESGVASRTISTLELWKVKDVAYEQTLLERMLGVARIIVTAHDAESPVIVVRGLPPDRGLYDRLMTAVMAARAQRGVMNVNP